MLKGAKITAAFFLRHFLAFFFVTENAFFGRFLENFCCIFPAAFFRFPPKNVKTIPHQHFFRCLRVNAHKKIQKGKKVKIQKFPKVSILETKKMPKPKNR